MASPKAYIYDFEKNRAIVCSYSIDLFNLVLKNTKSDSEVFTKEIDMISHKIYNKSSCNCKETIKELSAKMSSKLKTFEKVIVPLEFLELEHGNSHLLLCEIYKTSKKSDCKFAVINTTLRSKRDSNMENDANECKPKYCLLRLHSIFSHDMVGFSDPVGRNNSLSTKSPVFKNCYKEISRELAGKGALPSDISQKCLHSRDTNRCWFDYGKIMDICIHYKVSAKDIAEIIKEIAAIDPMKPDPVMCIKGRLGVSIGRQKECHKKKMGGYSDHSDVVSASLSSSEKTTTSSSSTSEIVCKIRSPPELKNKIHRGRAIEKKRGHRSAPRHKSISKETQTSNCTQSETQTDSVPCICYKRTANTKMPLPPMNDGSMNKYLWTPNYYDCNEYEDPGPHYNDCIDEPLIFDDENQYQNYSDVDRDINYDINETKRFPCNSAGSLDDRSNFKDGDYDSRIYEDFLRNSDYLEQEEDAAPNFNVDEPPYGSPNKECSQDGSRKRMNSMNARLQPTMKFHLKVPANNLKCQKYGNSSNSVDAMRSSSQPMLPTKNPGYPPIDEIDSPQNRSSHQSQVEIKTVPLPKMAVDSGTQTLAPSPSINIDEGINLQLKKCVSEGNILRKVYVDHNDHNNSTGESVNALSHIGVNTYLSLNTSKTFKMEAVQTDNNCQMREDGYFVQQRKYESLIPKYVYGRMIESSSSINSSPGVNFINPKFKTSSKNDGKSMIVDRHASSRLVFDGAPFSLNRNDNNHSISRSPSSRNSQIVEVDNDNMEKISSVIVDQDSRPIIYFDGKDHIYDESPFYERGEIYSDFENYRPNTNINNSIRTVTVSNKDPTIVNVQKCSIPGCQNIADGYNYTCENHASIQSQSCSPERCLSRLSCIVALNRQMLEGCVSPDPCTVHSTALRRVIYGPYDNTDCDELLAEAMQRPIKYREYQNESFPSDNLLNVPNLCNQHRGNSANPSPVNQNDTLHHSLANNQTQHSAIKMSRENYVECFPMVGNSTPMRYINEVNNPAQVFYQSRQEEQVTPMHSIPMSECCNANVMNTHNTLGKVSHLNSPLSNIALSSGPNNRDNDLTCIESPKYKIWNERVMESRPTENSSQNSKAKYVDPRTENNQDSIAKQCQMQVDKLINSYNMKLPLNFTVCPITGCRNITITGQPSCLGRNSHDANLFKSDRLLDQGMFVPPYQKYDSFLEPTTKTEPQKICKMSSPTSVSEQNKAPVNNLSKLINHGEVHDYDNKLNNNEIIFNDSVVDLPSKYVSLHEDVTIDVINLESTSNKVINPDDDALESKVPSLKNAGASLIAAISRDISAMKDQIETDAKSLDKGIFPDDSKLIHASQLSESLQDFTNLLDKINVQELPKYEAPLNDCITPSNTVSNKNESSVKGTYTSITATITHKRHTSKNPNSEKIPANENRSDNKYLENLTLKNEQRPTNESLRSNVMTDFTNQSERMNLEERISNISPEPLTSKTHKKELSLTTVYLDTSDHQDIVNPVTSPVTKNAPVLFGEYSATENPIDESSNRPNQEQAHVKKHSLEFHNISSVKVEFNDSNIESPDINGVDLLHVFSEEDGQLIVVDVNSLSPKESGVQAIDLIDKLSSKIIETKENASASVTNVKPCSNKSKRSSIRNVSSSSRPPMEGARPCGGINDLYSTFVRLPSSRHSKMSSITSDKRQIVNNSSFYNYNSNNDKITMDYLYLDGLTTKVRSRKFSDTILFKDPDYLVLGKCNNMFYSTPELILNKHSNHILVSERWDIHSDLVLENLDNMTVSLPALVDHPNNEIFLLISLSVYFLFCKQLPILMHIALLPTKIKKSKINRLIKSFRHSRSQQPIKTDQPSKVPNNHKYEKLELIKNFKNKMSKMIRKCRSSKLSGQERNIGLSTFSVDQLNSVNRSSSLKSISGEEECLDSRTTMDPSECTLVTRSCNNLYEDVSKLLNNCKQWNSEPTLNQGEYFKVNRKGDVAKRLMLSQTEISTSDLSLLCVEVLKKMNNKCMVDPRIGDEMSSDHFCPSSALSDHISHSVSSKDTLKLIIKALKYLHHSQFDDSGPSNKTLDSVSSIKTCSEDRLQSIKSLRQQIVRPTHNDPIVISAYNKII